MSSWISNWFCILVYSIEISDAYCDVKSKQWDALTFLNICLVAHILVLFPEGWIVFRLPSIWSFFIDAHWDSTMLDTDICATLFDKNCGFCVKINANKCYQIHVCTFINITHIYSCRFLGYKQYSALKFRKCTDLIKLKRTPTHE